MNISERDLFNFVFFRYLVDNEKVGYLESTDLYKEEIELLTLLKQSESEELDDEIKLKLSKVIPSYKFLNIIELLPVEVERVRKPNDNILRFAADSAELQPKNSSETFLDKNNKYLVKLIRSGVDTKIFIFSTKNEELKNIKITLEPQNMKFHLEDNNKPLELQNFAKIQKIKLEFPQLEMGN